MSEIQANMEDLAKAAGISISDEPNFDESPLEQATEEPVQESIVEEQIEEPAPQQMQDSSLNSDQLPEEDFDARITSVLSERLGIEINSIDDLSGIINREPEAPSIDERIAKIAEFVEKTGRGPEDWFKYQQLNPSEMDDLSAIKLETMNQYPTLSSEQVNKLVTSRYKLDEEVYSEEEVELSKIQLTIDADKARTGINDLRENFMLPVQKSSEEATPLFDDQWVSNMAQEVESIEALEFELGDSTFSFGLDDNYKSKLIDKNANLEQYFDSYVDDKGNWDIESLSMHRALVDNIDVIAKSIYQQGLSDGQRNIVSKAANVQAGTPGVGQQTQSDGVLEQIKQALGGSDTLMRFK
jgi:hypothetical protein